LVECVLSNVGLNHLRLTKQDQKKTKGPWRLCKKARAHTEADRQTRLGDLLHSCLRLFKKMDYNAINIQTICQDAGLAKGTFYLYFTTKEEAFLKLTEQLFLAWHGRCLERLSIIPASAPVQEVVSAYTQTLETEALLLELLSNLHSVTERNVSFDSIRAFKRLMVKIQMEHVAVMQRVFPEFSAAKANQLIQFVTVAMMGGWKVSNPPAIARKAFVTEFPDWPLPTFSEIFSEMLETYLHGLKSSSRNVG
jgi:AcrR family transcriptional regulator